ncbi:AIPR protein [compost metagenome]
MSKIHVTQVKRVLDELYSDLIEIDMNKNGHDQKSIFYTRSLAAYAVKMLSNATNIESVDSVTDGFGDNGIDFIHIDNESKRLIIGQSKWTHEGQKSPELGEILKFIKGFNDLINGELDSFNKEIKELSNDIEDLVSNTQCKLIAVIVYSGSQPISKEIYKELENLKGEYNNISEILDYKVIDLKKIYQSIPYVGQGLPINANLSINNYGKIEEPYIGLYGKVDASEIYNLYNEFGEFLFEKNLRKFITDSSINESVQATLVESPEKFWYFNNGITVLCNKLNGAPKGANSKSGTFTLEGINIVNGAQTVGNIFKAKERGADISKASVMIKVISLDECEDDIFADEITKSTNSQNRILTKDFITLDSVHKRLYKEMILYNYKYLYKTGDMKDSNESSFYFETAATSLACANDNIRYAMLAKTSVGKLWEDINKPPYSTLFNSKTTGLRVLRSVLVASLVEKELEKIEWMYGKLTQHSNRFMLHMVFCCLPKEKFDDPDFQFNVLEESISKNFKSFFTSVKHRMDILYPSAHIYHFFRNGSKCSHLKTDILNNIQNPF